MKRARGIRTKLLPLVAGATLLQTAPCIPSGLSAAEQEQLARDLNQIVAVTVGNLVTNTVSFFLTNSIVRLTE